MSGLILLLCTLFISGTIANHDWLRQVTDKLLAVMPDKDELAMVLWSLANEANENGGFEECSNCRILNDLIHTKNFAVYAQKILQEAKKSKQPSRDYISDAYAFFKMQFEGSDALWSKEHISWLITMGINFGPGLSKLETDTQISILELILPFEESFSKHAVSSMKDFVKCAASHKYAGPTLFGVYLSYEAMKDVYRWWNDEISGARVAKNIVDSCAGMTGSIGGSVAGAAAGSYFGPIGKVIGGIVGGIAGGRGAMIVVDKLTLELFNIPKDEALERAYNFLGVSKDATNIEINKAFYALSVKHNPDKGGSYEEFINVQSRMAIIKVARGEEY